MKPVSPPRHNLDIPQVPANLPSSSIPSALLPQGFYLPITKIWDLQAACVGQILPQQVCQGPVALMGRREVVRGQIRLDWSREKPASGSAPLLKSQGSPRAFPALLASHNSLDILHRPLTLHLNKLAQ